MLDIKNIPVSDINVNKRKLAKFVEMKNNLDVKMASYLRYLGTKNAINRASDYHYLNLAVTNSTAPVNGIDYIHPSVKPVVDYATAVIAKGLMPNGEINFDFVADTTDTEAASRQATSMVNKVVNQMNDPHFILERWVMDSAMHKNGMMMIKPVREQITRYIDTDGTLEQLRAFEAQAQESGLTALRQSRRKDTVDLEKVLQEVQALLPEVDAEYTDNVTTEYLNAVDIDEESADGVDTNVMFSDMESKLTNLEAPELLEGQQDVMQEAIKRNTIYKAKYKLTGYNINIKFHPIEQHYWVCDPTVPEMRDQPFCGFYDPMTIAEAMELYPDINLDEFEKYADYNSNGAFQGGAVLNNLAIHARDSVPVQGIPINSAADSDPAGRQISVVTVWNRCDIDGDGEVELIEIVYSGSYIISAKEVEFIPVANMCPKPLPGNFYGYSIAESVIPMQEYLTSAMRAEIQLGLLTATPRIGVKPDKVDFEMMQDGEAAIFILDSKFNPQTDVYPVPPPSGNIQFLEVAMNRIQQDTMAMVGMTTPQDVFNPEVMAAGNSGVKLQLALSPNQIVQDNTVRNSAEGLKEALWLVWRTLIQYGDDYGVKKLASESHPDNLPVFLDYAAWDDMNFTDRKQMVLELAVGMQSEENAINRQQIIRKTQTELYSTVQQMATSGVLTPELFVKIKKPFADTLYVLGVKDCDAYLPTDEEVGQMIQAGAEAAKNATLDPLDKERMSKVNLNTAKAVKEKIEGEALIAELNGTDAETQLDYLSIATKGLGKVYS
jgi:hypothetical protein